MRKSIDRLLRANDYRTDPYASAEEFLLSEAADSALALVLDMHLPGMSGLSLCKRLQEAGSRLPIVFITAYEDEAMRAEALATGCLDYLQKPFEAERLTAALERAAKR